jgi:Tfp pilus assembly protein FimV
VKYYHKNRPWLAKMRIWGTYDGYRRPSSGFILATLSVLEPKLDDIFPFILELNNNPDQIIAALGLNFNPDEQLHLIEDLDESINHDKVNRNIVEDKVIYDTFRAEKRDDIEINKPPTSQSTAITKIERFPLAQKIVPTSESIEREFQVFSELVQENPPQKLAEQSMVAQLESENEILSLLSMCDQPEEAKIVKVSSEKETEEAKSACIKKVSNLASWIDEFCQGAGWDREEAIFIPF